MQTPRILLFAVAALGLAGCFFVNPFSPFKSTSSTVIQENEIPSILFYVVAMDIETRFGEKNELVVLDAITFEEINRTPLMDNSLFFKFSQDPLGQIWIGYGGTLENKTKRVDVFQRDGSPLKSMELCTWPNVEISFAANRAFVPCYLNGFQAGLAVLELESLELTKMLDLEAEPHFMLLSSAADGRTVVIPGGSETHATIIFLNPETLEELHRSLVYGGANFATIISYENRFYMLNRGSSLSEDPIDMRIVELGDSPTITDQNLAERSPFLGFISEGILWTYHHRSATSKDSEKRAIAQYNLETGESRKWPLPDYWWAGDMILLNGKIVLTRRHSVDPNETDGLYEFDPETGQLNQILELPGAHLLLASESD